MVVREKERQLMAKLVGINIFRTGLSGCCTGTCLTAANLISSNPTFYLSLLKMLNFTQQIKLVECTCSEPRIVVYAMLDDEIKNPDPQIVAHAREFGVDVDRVLSEEVHSESFSKDTDNSFEAALNSHMLVYSTSVGQNSRPSAVGTSAFGYDGSRGGTDDGGDNAGEYVGQQQ
ncbi:hypothetical protein AAG906_014600 [Vitis piasezkii]